MIPVAERALQTGDPDELVALLTGRVEDEVRTRFAHARQLKARANGSVEGRRAYVEARLGLQVWAHGLYEATTRPAHEHGTVHVHRGNLAH